MSASRTELHPEAAAFLAGGPQRGMIAGADTLAADGKTLPVIDPAMGETIGQIAALGAAEVDGAVGAAAEAFAKSGWADSADRRCALLEQLIALLEERKAVLAQIESIDCGKILRQAEYDVQAAIDVFRYYLAMPPRHAHPIAYDVPRMEALSVRRPWGPCGIILPWNFPLMLLAWSAAPALAAGNTVIIKPSEDASLSAICFARLAREAGIPAGVINVVPGAGETAGAALAAHPGLRRMAFTGSTAVGRQVAASCGGNLVPAKLELGGKGAALVFADADVKTTARRLAETLTYHAGQVCANATRWLVERSIYEPFVEAALARLKRITVGHPWDRSTQMGPVISHQQHKRILDYLDQGREEGAEVVLEGGAVEVAGCDGYYLKPALLAGPPENIAAREEIFGPVAYLMAFDSEAEAVALANQTDYGLANSVWSSDLDRCRRVAEALVAGNNWIGGHNLFPIGVPYAGIGASGLGGGVLSEAAYLDHLRAVSIIRPVA